MGVCCCTSLAVTPMVDGSYHDENGYLGVVGIGHGLISEDKVSVDESMVGGEQLVCDGMINATLLAMGYEGLAGKDVIKARFALTGVTMTCMVRCCGMIAGND